jgi:hypothetical protein
MNTLQQLEGLSKKILIIHWYDRRQLKKLLKLDKLSEKQYLEFIAWYNHNSNNEATEDCIHENWARYRDWKRKEK